MLAVLNYCIDIGTVIMGVVFMLIDKAVYIYRSFWYRSIMSGYQKLNTMIETAQEERSSEWTCTGG